MNREELAWAAGFLDGEGCFYLSHRRNWNQIQFRISQADRRPLDRFAAIMGFGAVSGPYDNGPRCKPIWVYTATKFETVQSIAARLWPWLCQSKRDQYTRTSAGYLVRYQETHQEAA